MIMAWFSPLKSSIKSKVLKHLQPLNRNCDDQPLLFSLRRIVSHSFRPYIRQKLPCFRRKSSIYGNGGSEASPITESGEICNPGSTISDYRELASVEAIEESNSEAFICEGAPAGFSNNQSFSVLNQPPLLLERFRDTATLERYVDEIESISPLRSNHLEWIYHLMVATSNQSSTNGAKLTERLLKACLAAVAEDRSKEPVAKVLPYPSRGMYSLAITAWTKARTTHAYGAKRATKVLELMAQEYKSEVDFVNRLESSTRRPVMTHEPHLINYSTVIDAWAKSDTDDAPIQAEQLLGELEQQSGVDKILATGIFFEKDIHHLTPDIICYNTVMSAWSRSDHREAIAKTEEIVARLKKLHEITGNATYKPNVYTYTILIEAYSKPRGMDKISRPMEAERVLKDMYDLYTSKDRVVGASSVRPNIIAYNNVMQAWVNTSNPQRAESILMAIMGKNTEIKTVPIVPKITPTLISFNIVINGWARKGGPSAGERAENILALMDQVKDAYGIPMPIAPTTQTLNTVMNAWSRSGSTVGAARADGILTSLLEEGGALQPTSISFVTAIHAHAISGTPGGAQRAEQILHMQKLYYNVTQNESVRPSEPSYASVLLAWNLRSAYTEKIDGLYGAEHAEALLERYEHETGNKPSLKMMQDAIQAWSHHDPDGILVEGPNKVDRARLLLSRVMNEMPAQLTNNKMSFCIMLRVCNSKMSGVSLRREAFFTAIETYNRLQRDTRFSTHALIYVEMFKLLKTHLPEKRDARYMSLAETLFDDCCRDGYLSPSVIKAAIASNHLPEHVHNLLSGDKKDWPENWHRLVGPSSPRRHVLVDPSKYK